MDPSWLHILKIDETRMDTPWQSVTMITMIIYLTILTMEAIGYWARSSRDPCVRTGGRARKWIHRNQETSLMSKRNKTRSPRAKAKKLKAFIQLRWISRRQPLGVPDSERGRGLGRGREGVGVGFLTGGCPWSIKP